MVTVTKLGSGFCSDCVLETDDCGVFVGVGVVVGVFEIWVEGEGIDELVLEALGLADPLLDPLELVELVELAGAEAGASVVVTVSVVVIVEAASVTWTVFVLSSTMVLVPSCAAVDEPPSTLTTA